MGYTKCFVVEKEDNEKDSRKLVFEDGDNEVMQEFKQAITMMTNMKMYIEATIKLKEKIDTSISDYITNAHAQDSDTVHIKDLFLNADHTVNPILSQLQYHRQLTRLTLYNCGLGDNYFIDLLDLLAHNRI